MAAGYFAAGKTAELATFEFMLRRLPRNRDYLVVAGLPQIVDYLLNLSFEAAEIEYLRGLPQFGAADPDFFEYLRGLKFTGDLFAVPEGTVLYAGEPILTLRAPIIEAQIPETYLLSAITFQSLIASKASRMVRAAEGRPVVEFGTRRAHTPDAGVLGARAAYIGGCAGTSNTLAGFRYGLPVFGTAAHSWTMAFAGESEAFRQLQKLLGERTVYLVDTYDTLAGTRRAIALGEPFWGVRLDSGDFLTLTREVRTLLDGAGLRHAKIMISGDLDEHRIAELVAAGAPIDSFGVGTELATSADAPSMGAVYKLVEIDVAGMKRYTMKLSPDKQTMPGPKQIFRLTDRDVITRSGECVPKAEALLKPVIIGGQLVQDLPSLEQSRERARRVPSMTPRIEHSTELLALDEQTRGSVQ